MREIIENNSFFDIVRQVVNEGEYIVEIGGGVGESTVELLKIAKEKNTKVIVIDPFDKDSMPESYRYNYEDFVRNTFPYRDYLILKVIHSQSEEAEKFLEQFKIGFAFVDGLQYKGAVLSDLRITWHSKLICVDDANRSSDISQVPAALSAIPPIKSMFIKDRHAYLW